MSWIIHKIILKIIVQKIEVVFVAMDNYSVSNKMQPH